MSSIVPIANRRRPSAAGSRKVTRPFLVLVLWLVSGLAIADSTLSQDSVLVAPTTLLPDRAALASLTSSTGAPLANTEVRIGRATTRTNEQGQFVIPATFASSVTLRTGKGSQAKIIDVRAAMPRGSRDADLALFVVPKHPAAGRPARIVGTGFDPAPGATVVQVGENPTRVLAATGQELTLWIPETVPLGPQRLEVRTPGSTVRLFDLEVIGVEATASDHDLARGQSGKLQLQVRGSEAPVKLEVTNRTPRVISLSEGQGKLTVRTTGGTDNRAELQFQGRRRGSWSMDVESKETVRVPATESAEPSAARIVEDTGRPMEDTGDRLVSGVRLRRPRPSTPNAEPNAPEESAPDSQQASDTTSTDENGSGAPSYPSLDRLKQIADNLKQALPQPSRNGTRRPSAESMAQWLADTSSWVPGTSYRQSIPLPAGATSVVSAEAIGRAGAPYSEFTLAAGETLDTGEKVTVERSLFGRPASTQFEVIDVDGKLHLAFSAEVAHPFVFRIRYLDSKGHGQTARIRCPGTTVDGAPIEDLCQAPTTGFLKIILHNLDPEQFEEIEYEVGNILGQLAQGFGGRFRMSRYISRAPVYAEYLIDEMHVCSGTLSPLLEKLAAALSAEIEVTPFGIFIRGEGGR